jgi:hypothetical protein
LSDDEFEDAEDMDVEEDELDVEDLVEDDIIDVAGDDDDDVVDLLDDDIDLVTEVPVAVITDDPVIEVTEDEDDDVVDLDEELHPDDVEEALDVVLRERTVAAGLEGEDDDDEPDEPGEGGTKIVPRRENEFLCRSCFLVLPRHQLADEARMICRDCA